MKIKKGPDLEPANSVDEKEDKEYQLHSRLLSSLVLLMYGKLKAMALTLKLMNYDLLSKFNMHRCVREISGLYRTCLVGYLLDEKCNINHEDNRKINIL